MTDKPKLAVARAELTLARDDAYPLRRVPLKPDPLEALVDAFAMIDVAQHDHIEVVLDLVAMTPSATRHWRSTHVADKTAEELQPRLGWRNDLSTVLFGHHGGSRGRGDLPAVLWGTKASTGAQSWTGARTGTGVQGPPPRVYGLERADKRRQERVLSEALANPEPHFEFQLLVRTRSQTRGRAVALLQAVLAGMNQFDGDNSLRVVGNRRMVGMRFAGADAPWRRWSFDRRIDRWRFVARDNNIVGVSEVAGFMKPATASCRGDRIVRSEGALSAPPNDLIAYDFERPPADAYLIGAVGGGLTPERYVAAPLVDSFFSYSPGKSRWGKSEANLVRFAELARANRCSTLFLDPHADALARVKPYLAELGCADRIIELSIAAGETRTQIGWNPFAKANLVGEDAIGRQTQLITDALAATFGWGSRAPRASAILQATVQALLELSSKLPAAVAPTIFQIATMLESETWRDQVVPHLSRKRRRFWEETFPKYPGEATTPITNFIERLAGIESVAALLGSSTSTYDLRRAIDTRKIILVRLRGRGQINELLASLVVYDLMNTVMGRASVDPADRVPIHAWLDEVQTYDAAVKSQIAALLEETAKYGMRLHLLNQDPRALQERTLDAVVNNASHMLVTSVEAPKSAEWLAKALRKKVDPETIASIRQFHGIAQTTSAGIKSDPYRIRSVGLEEAYGPPPGTASSHAELQALIDQNSGRRPIADTLAALETLDERIIDALRRSRPGDAPTQTTQAASGGAGADVNRVPLKLVEPHQRAAQPYRPDSVRSSGS